MLRQHPLSQLVPPPTEEEYLKLRRAMKRDGFDPHFPIFLYEEKILDGWLRYCAAMDLKIKPTFAPYTGSDPAGFVLRACYRRNLNPLQVAIVEARMIRNSFRPSKPKFIERPAVKKVKATADFSSLSRCRDFLDSFAEEVDALPNNPWFDAEHALDLMRQLRALCDCEPFYRHEHCGGEGCEMCRHSGIVPKFMLSPEHAPSA